MDALNTFMSREQFPDELRIRLRDYFHQCKHLRMAGLQHDLITLMPPTLQGEVAWMTSATALKTVWFLDGAGPRFMIELSMELHPVVFAPSDVAPRGYMYIVQRGIALYNAKVLTKGKVWGDDVILHTESLRVRATARAMHYLEAYFISRDELVSLAERHPETGRQIRYHAVWMALRREMIALAGIVRGKQASNMLELTISDAIAAKPTVQDFAASKSKAKQKRERLKMARVNERKASMTVEELSALVPEAAQTAADEEDDMDGGGKLNANVAMDAHFDIMAGKLLAQENRIEAVSNSIAASTADLKVRFGALQDRQDRLTEEQKRREAKTELALAQTQQLLTGLALHMGMAIPDLAKIEDQIQDGVRHSTKSAPLRLSRHSSAAMANGAGLDGRGEGRDMVRVRRRKSTKALQDSSVVSASCEESASAVVGTCVPSADGAPMASDPAVTGSTNNLNC